MKAISSILLVLVFLSGCSEQEPPAAKEAGAAVSEPAPDLAAGEALARSCAGCHGQGPGEGKEDVPHIAGQNAGYLASAIRAYKEGARGDETMKIVKEPLSEQDILNVSAYLAALPADWGHAAAAGSADTAAAAGEAPAFAAPCASCHGPDGNALVDGMPSLAGLSRQYLEKTLVDYRDGARKDSMMAGFAASLSAAQVAEISAWYAGNPRTGPAVTVATGDAGAGESAAAACAACHGADGNSANPGFPSLTGQNAGYLVKAIRAYRDGGRSDAMMRNIAAALNDGDIENLAAFYAAQAPSVPAQQASPLSEEESQGIVMVDPVAEGKAAAGSCAGCHGADGNSQIPGMPSLAGLHPTYLAAAIGAYKDGTRPDPMMSGLVASLDEAAIGNIALYFAVQEPKATTAPATGDAAAGESLAAACGACHGQKGVSPTKETPSLAGQDAQYLAKAIKAYADGGRDHAVMKGAVEAFGEADVNHLAAFFAAQTPAAPEVRLPLTPQQWAQKCDRCHGPGGVSVDPNVPRLAGQRQAYLALALSQYHAETRKSSAMHAMSYPLSEVEIQAIAAYYAEK